MFRSESDLPLIGCGVDSEQIERFNHLSSQESPWPLVFTPKETSHIRSLSNQAEGFCAAFCVKEALLKAVQQPINLTDCEFFLDPATDQQRADLALALRREFQITAMAVRICRPVPTEILAIVHVFSGETT